MSEQDKAMIDLKKIKDNLYERQKQIQSNLDLSHNKAKYFLQNKE